ncbi:MAG: hypothetical protein ICV83_02445 [Cytophagales bacterium]|nr:hypothetical protein [Cytophagales bacterium]
MKKRTFPGRRPFGLLFLLLVTVAAPLAAQDCGGAFYQPKPNASFTLTTYNAKGKPALSATHQYKSVDKTANGVTARLDVEMFDDKDKSMGTNSYDLTCEKGTIKLNMREFAMMGAPTPGNLDVQVSGDDLLLPPSLQPGQALGGANFTLVGRLGEVKIMDRTFTVKDRKVEDQETIQTPAGKFECYKISYLTDVEGMLGKVRTFKTVVWYAKGPGMVRNESYDDKGKMTGYTVLTKYQQ